MRLLLTILTLASLLALMACRGTGELEIIPAGGPVTTDSSRDARTNTPKDRTEPTSTTTANAMPRKALGPGAAEKTESYSPDALPANPASPPNGGYQHQRVEPSLKTGEVDDNKRWDEYLDFMEKYQGPPAHDTNLSKQQIITILDQEGRPAPNAKVTISLRANGLETPHDVEQYSIDRLDSLTVQLIEEELAKPRTGVEQSGMMTK